MILREKQSKFIVMLALLILHAKQLGYELTLGRGFVSEKANEAEGGHKDSLHLDKLAQDINLFKEGIYLRGENAKSAHTKLHNYWDSIGGAERIKKDMNHYSLAHRGMR